MEKNHFLFKDKIKEIENKFNMPNGWLKIYEQSTSGYEDFGSIFCCLVSNNNIDEYNGNYHWPLTKGSEGKPAVFGDKTYKTYLEEGLEPFLFYREFSIDGDYISYVDVSEEFILYFKLYEKGIDKKHRIFCYINDYGELEEVLIIEENLIKVKTKFLKEYITIRDMHFCICYDYMRLINKLPNDWEISFKDETISKSEIIYNHLIKYNFDKYQSWIMGKVFFQPSEIKKTYFDNDNYKYEDFIIGYDENGEYVYKSCGGAKGLEITYFKKEVLDKYYNEPTKYQIDGFGIHSHYFTLKTDNNRTDYVPVFLKDLRILSDKEQLHWKQYNIPPSDGMSLSNTYYQTMIKGQWAKNPEAPDLFFKSKYEEFNKNWENKFGWKLYKPLSIKDSYLFTSLHLITSNNIKTFCEQTLTIVKLTIDRLNEKEIAKYINLGNEDRGIVKFEKFLKEHKIEVPEMFTFLRNLQSLRSGLIAHSFSDTNKECKKALEYFEIKDDNLILVFKEILIKSVYTLNTLEEKFNINQ